MYDAFISLVRQLYPNQDIVPLHAPVFRGQEKQLVCEAIDSTFVSTVGTMVTAFESRISEFVGTRHAIATMNGTAALHAALMGVGVTHEHEVITQSLTFVATCNAIAYCGANPVFVDVDRKTAGMSAEALRHFLLQNVDLDGDVARNRKTGNIISACVPMHTFGLALEMAEIHALCDKYNIALIEDAAEALGTRIGDRMAGSFGRAGVLSFNGNKILTTGGGGMVVTDDDELAGSIRHLTTTARQPRRFRFSHDCVGYNYRMPNLNAALGLAQFEQLQSFLEEKRVIADRYHSWVDDKDLTILRECAGTWSNYWLNALVFEDMDRRDGFLEFTNQVGIQTRAAWDPLHTLPMYEMCQRDTLENTDYLYQRIVNIPSGVAA